MHSIFGRLMAVFLVVILACALVMTAIFYNTFRQSFYESTYDYLISQAQDLAYVSATNEFNPRSGAGHSQSVTNWKYIEQKTRQLEEDYHAYCVITYLDRKDGEYIFGRTALHSDTQLESTYNEDYLKPIIAAVQNGQDIVRKETDTPNGTMFTVAVPIKQSDTITGAVFIQTAPQAMRSAFTHTIWPIVLVSLISILVSAVVIFFLTRSVVQPLTQMEHVANALAEGDFTTRADETGSRETKALAHAFNGMAVQLEELENSRREFLANVSHELRSPITSIQGYMQSMLDGTIPQTDHKQYMQTVVDETRRLSKLINSLLNLSRMERDEIKLAMSHFDLNELTRRVIITKIQQIEDNDIELNVDFATDPCFVHADSDQITQVLVNLVDNALKFTPKDGELTIRTRIEKNLVYVTVLDNGEAISPEDAPHLFDRFYKADKAHTVGKGTGLGLAICKRIMEKHGQKIYLLPTDTGAAFEFTLEKGEAPAQERNTEA